MTASLDPTLRITEIFHSLQGEARSVGLPTVFVRLTGCPLRCVWCDTEYAFSGGEILALDQILTQITCVRDGGRTLGSAGMLGAVEPLV